jgi:hypothetical protein
VTDQPTDRPTDAELEEVGHLFLAFLAGAGAMAVGFLFVITFLWRTTC